MTTTASDVVVTAHQMNFLPGVSVIERVRRADLVIWLDETQFERHSFVNRNRLRPAGSWLTIPVQDGDHFAPINRVRIADPDGSARREGRAHARARTRPRPRLRVRRKRSAGRMSSSRA